MKRHLVLVAPLLLAACNSAAEWENQQAQLANEANGVTAAPEETNVLADTDYINTASPAENDVNAASTADNDVNEVSPAENETALPEV